MRRRFRLGLCLCRSFFLRFRSFLRRIRLFSAICFPAALSRSRPMRGHRRRLVSPRWDLGRLYFPPRFRNLRWAGLGDPERLGLAVFWDAARLGFWVGFFRWSILSMVNHMSRYTITTFTVEDFFVRTVIGWCCGSNSRVGFFGKVGDCRSV